MKTIYQNQKSALQEYQTWINMLLGLVYQSNYKNYALQIKNVFILYSGIRKNRIDIRKLHLRKNDKHE